MSERVMRAVALIEARDKASEKFAKLAKQAENVARTVKLVETATVGLNNAMIKGGDVAGLTKARTELQRLGAEYKTAQARVREFARAAKAGGDAAASAGYQKAVADVRRLSAAYDRAKTSAAQATQQFKTAKIAAATANATPIPARGVRPSPGSRGKHAKNEWLSGDRSLAGTVGAAAVGVGMERAGEKVVHTAADVEQSRFRIRELSRNNPSESGLADDIAREIAAKYPAVTIGKALDNWIEMRANSLDHDGKLDPQAARRNAFAAARAQNAATALGIDMTPTDMQNLLKGIEGSGRADDPKAVEKISDAYIRAKQVFGSAIASQMVRDYVANAKAANFSIGDDQFYLSNMVRMSEGNASRLGNETNQTLSTLAGGRMTKATGKWLTEYGLANGPMENMGGGNVRIKGGVKDSDLLETAQNEWASGPLRKAIEAHGDLSDDKVKVRMGLLRMQALRKDPKAQIDEHALREQAVHGLVAGSLQRAGWRATVADNLAHAIGNAHLIARDSKAMQNASGLSAGDRIGQNPIGAATEFVNSLTNLASVVGSPAVAAAGPVLDGLAKTISSVAESVGSWSKDHPDLAKAGSAAAIGGLVGGGGALTYGVLQGLTTGFGLQSSAVALDASAAALTAAAGKLGFEGVVPELPGKKGAPSKSGVLGRAGLWAAGLTGPVAATIVGTGAIISELEDPANVRRGIVHGGKPTTRSQAGDMLPGVGSDEDAAAPAARNAPGPISRIYAKMVELGDRMQGVQVPAKGLEAVVKPDQITAKAEVSGEATVKHEFTINFNAGAFQSYFDGRIAAQLSKIRLHTNGPGSAGRSSPDAE